MGAAQGRRSIGERFAWVVLQVNLVVIIIFWPGSVAYWLDKPVATDPSTIKIEIPQNNLLPLDLGPLKN
jgi:hypothetical protein